VDVPDESAVVNDNGTLQHVFVYLEDAPATGDGARRQPALLDQVNCRYVPHALGVQAGQTLRVRSSDATLHNVHALSQANRAFNLSMTRAGEEKTVTFAKHEFVPLKCDVHPWMTAYVGVFENLWFAVTDHSGTFEITNVPEGSYKLVAWHERYGRVEQEVWVGSDKPLDVMLEYRQN
jgi:plastocyanin